MDYRHRQEKPILQVILILIYNIHWMDKTQINMSNILRIILVEYKTISSDWLNEQIAVLQMGFMVMVLLSVIY